MALFFPRMFDDVLDVFDTIGSLDDMMRTPQVQDQKRQRNTMTGWTPRCDVVENNNALVISAEVPGMKPEDVSIEYDNKSHILSVKGESRSEESTQDKNASGIQWQRRERRYGSFERRFAVPDTFDADNITAKCNNGILDVTIPKRALPPAKETVKRITVS